MSTSRLTTLTEEQKKLFQPTVDSEIAALNKTYTTSADTIKNDYGTQIKQAEQDYNELFDENSVQRIINEQQIAENMANAGLTDSGLNRTQLTANQLGYANRSNKIAVEKQRAVDDLARVMQSSLSSLEAQRAQQEQSIRSGYDQQAVSNATSAYNAEQEAAAEQYKAQMEAITAAAKLSSEQQATSAKNKTAARTALLKNLSNTEMSNETKQALIDDYIYSHGATDDDYYVLKGLGYDISGKNGYLNPEESQKRISVFKARFDPIFGPKIFSGDTKTANKYKKDAEAQIKKFYDQNMLTEEEVAELLAYYDIE